MVHWSVDTDVIDTGTISIPSQENWIPMNSNWEYLENRTHYHSHAGNIDFVFKLRRKPHYYVWNLFVPAVILTILQICSFQIPPYKTDRPAFSVTVMLALFLLNSLFFHFLPTSPLPTLASYYATAVIAFGTLCTIFSTTLHWLLQYHKVTMKSKVIGIFKKKSITLYTLIDFIGFCIFLSLALIINIVFISSMLVQ